MSEARDVTPSVAIVGAGCAGTLTAANLLRAADGPLRVLLIERSAERAGRGVAYSTPDERHLLNVVAERMSAFPEEPGHFVRWARARGRAALPGTFLPRALYGAYLRDVLAEARRDAPATLFLSDGRRIAADEVVLALGGLDGPPPVALPSDPRVIADPWAPGALAGAAPEATTLLIGSGLTAVDVALSVTAAGPRSRVVAVSRGGCLPFEQPVGLRQPVPAPELPAAPATVERLERWFACHVARSRRAGHDWRDVLDGVRPHVPALWRSLPVAERRRFLRERGRAWELRRHRMAPEIAAQLRRLLDEGRLLVRAGRIVAVRALPRHVEVLVETGPDEIRTLRADRVVVCAGPGGDVTRSRSPLLRALLERGTASPDELSLGIRADEDGALIGADDRVRPRVRVLGPLRRGELYETTAVGEIRVQAQRIARTLASAPVRA
jgi:uncharacterized NAD(P)/FAD-binding protein YdhS